MLPLVTDAVHIRAVIDQRTRSNRAIADRDVERVVAFMLPDITVAVAGGPRLTGREASRKAFAEQFADPAFRGYVRTPATVTVQQSPLCATERGRWVGTWQTRAGVQHMRGTYVAEWQHTAMGWLLLSEAFTSVET